MRKLFFVLCLLTSVSLWAQKTVKGIVVDNAKEPIIGASVVEVGTSNGIITDLDGKFTLKVGNNAQVRISYVGFKTKTLSAKQFGSTELNITMEDDSEVLTEVVVTAYGGKQLRAKVTNSIAKVKEETLTLGVHTNPAQALSGAVAGLRVQQTSGDPGAAPTLVLRGGTNLNGTGSPLVIIDGAERSLADVNPEDIESMEVMKDAGATAIYGARANNGVVLVTTKRGKAGYSEIKLQAKFGWNYYHNQFQYLDGGEYLTYMRTAIQRASQYWKDSAGAYHGATNMGSLTGVQPYGTGNQYFAADGVTPLDGNTNNKAIWSTMKYTDNLAFLLKKGWQTMTDPVYGDQLIYKTYKLQNSNIETPAFTQEYNINMNGGNDKGNYYAGVGYVDSKGNATGNWYKRINFTFNGDYKIKPWLTSSSSFNFTDTKWYGYGEKAASNIYFTRVFSLPPTFRGTNENGDYIVTGRGGGDGNVLMYLNSLQRDNNTDKFTMNQAFTFDLYKGLTLKTTANWYYQDTKYESFTRDYLTNVNTYYKNRDSSDSYERVLKQTYNAVLNYQNTFAKDHFVDAMVGMEYYDNYTKGFSASGYGATTDDFQDLQYTSSKENARSIDSWHGRQRIMSFFGRLNYDYQSKYLVSMVLRRDGYSKLAKDNRWGFFPGISAGWVFGKEKFMEKYRDIISFAKLRASYGANGNVSDIDNYTVQGAYGAVTNYNGATSLVVTTVPNPGLRWEKSYTFEGGLDISFLQNRLNANITLYNRHTKDKFANIVLPSHSGISSILSNNGEVQNKGLEMQLNARILDKKDLKWDVVWNMAYNKNKIVALPNNGLERNRQSAFQVYTGNGEDKMWVGGYQEGQEPGVIYAFKAERLYKSYDEIPGNLIDKTTGNNGANGKYKLYGPTAWAALTDAEKSTGRLPIQPGDVKWKDVNNDGVIDDYDMVKIGNTVPHWTGGITSNVSYKGFTLTCQFDYALGFWVRDTFTPWTMGNMQGTYNTITKVRDTWSDTNVNAKYPTYTWADQLGKRNYARESSMFCYRGDYVAIRQLSLAWDLPKAWLHKLAMQKVVLNITGQNLGYITAAKNMFSPEYNADANGGYSLPRTLIVGASVTF